ncbi:hypothetical protein BKA66DRAFT_416936 [Pyrenochaeta sp. MPI-SDFR-AT-0127]|nr:hypothetical protein BKA66DRAFT_416936 [Pyrenochaeta sp. MPI-SDFR-AT-0127]
MLKALGVKNSSCQNELHSLGDAVQDAINLLKRVSGSGLTAAIRPKIKPRGGEVDKIHIPGQNRSHANGAKHNLRRRNTPPFLTWAWLSSEYDKSVRPERLAAENLFAIMEDIDRNLRRRNEISYTLAMEISLAEWDERISGSQQQLSYISSAHPDSSLLYASTHLSPRIIGGSPSSPRRSIVDFLGEDALLQAQKSAIHAAIDDLSTHAKNFVGLFIPCSYQHAVSKKIWGSLSLLLKSATSSLGDEERERQNYIIRPLDAEFMTSHGIEQPPFALQDCSACRDGHVHKSVQDAVYHLKRVHFKYESRLSELAHLQTTHHHWVRTENQVRNELANKHQLRLLQICLSYLKTLYARAEKIHLGISHDEKTDVVRYQLPNDLVDCFEATALFIMQCATSLIAIEDEMRRWQHVPGLSLEDIKTPVVEYAVERLGELGQAAQSSMTRAEKTLALSDPETNVVSMGATGPELLLLVLFQNLQKKQLLEGIDMDVNQLYQESASKLQYQVNQFPRKRLLRDIHALQEELSVIQVVNSWQQRSFESLVKVLDPHSFENPSPSRVTMFPSESECLTASLKDLDSKITELDALKNRTQYLREQLKQSVEILEEDHGKAILVFTMITTIFLPLSFVTSFFGMNTSDIRNTSRGQDFFWAIAIPVTAGIVFLAVLLAYHGDKLYDAVVQVVHQLRKKRTQRVAQPEHRQLWSKKPLPLHQRSWSLRRHSGFGLKQLDSGAMRLR